MGSLNLGGGNGVVNTTMTMGTLNSVNLEKVNQRNEDRLAKYE